MAVGVESEQRRRGLGTALLERCLDHARSLGGEIAVGTVWEDDEEAFAFATRHGFVEFERGVELVLDLSDVRSPAPPPPEGIEIVELSERHYATAYDVWVEGVNDMPSTEPPTAKPFERWLEEARSQALVLVGLQRGTVVGYAALEDRDAGVGENELTTVRRSHRRRGIAEALKRAQLAWAAEHGYRTIVTGTDEENVGMRRLNEKLGYLPLPASILLRRGLADR